MVTLEAEQYEMLRQVLQVNPSPRWGTWLALNRNYGLGANQAARLMAAALRMGRIYEHNGVLYNNGNYGEERLAVHKDVLAQETKSPYTD